MSDTLVLVLTHGRPDLTLTCLRSIHTHAPDVDLLWIDNGSDGIDVDAVGYGCGGNLPNRRMLLGENLGFPRAINLGLQYFLDGPWKYVVIQNNDTEIFDDVYARMRRVLDGGTWRGICGTLSDSTWQDVLAPHSPVGEHARRFRKLGHADRANLAAELFGDEAMPVPGMVCFFATMLDRACVEDVGMLDAGYGMGMGEDDDYCLRARAASCNSRMPSSPIVPFHVAR
jgi:GT2 family glycosyltransferase